jgi:hypothetical protein
MRRFRVSVVLFVLSSASLASGASALGLASCKGDSATTDDDGSTTGVNHPFDAHPATDDGAVDMPADDAASDADAYVPPVILPSCVGTSIPMTIDGVRAFAEVSVQSLDGGGYFAKGPFVVDFGSTGSTIDLNGFGDGGAPTPVSCGGDASAPGAFCTFQGFDFFGDWGTVYLVTGDYSVLFGSVRQAGIIATDFLSKNPISLDFGKKQILRSDPTKFCTDAELLGSGFRPLPAGGFYTSDTSKLRPLSEVLDNPDATAGYVVPNVPTVPVNVAGTSALAQLDTGYEDRLSRRSLNVNEALFAILNGRGVLTRALAKDLYATTCIAGYSEWLEAFTIAPGQTLEFVNEGGTVVRTDSVDAVYLKHSTATTYPCGGIATWTVPAAQVGASFFIDAQAVIMDPITSRVWVPGN